MVVVEVRQGTLGVGGRGWCPAENTVDRGSQLSQDDEDDEDDKDDKDDKEDEEEEERRTRQEEAEEEQEEEATDIKSNNPHLAGGEKRKKKTSQKLSQLRHVELADECESIKTNTNYVLAGFMTHWRAGSRACSWLNFCEVFFFR